MSDFLGYEICVAHKENQSLEDASNFPDFVANQAHISQMLGVGLQQGRNAYEFNGTTYVAMIFAQNPDGSLFPLTDNNPEYIAAVSVVAGQLLCGKAIGMLGRTPDGGFVPIVQPIR